MMRRSETGARGVVAVRLLAAILLCASSAWAGAQGAAAPNADTTANTISHPANKAFTPARAAIRPGAEWFEASRFGMFICWNDSVMPATEWTRFWNQWKLTTTLDPYAGEPSWYEARSKIPVAKYVQIPPVFNPQKYDPDAWVALAKEAGMKYIVFTAKHHDGFCMYDTKVSDYDVIDRTPFKRDVVKDLAEACARHGLKMCLYYSQSLDWYEPGGWGNTWDYAFDPAKFDDYINQKVVPQLRELLTGYGPIGLIWFDTAGVITRDESLRLADLVHGLQPACLVNSRLGNYVYDYLSMPDKAIPVIPQDGPWETASTMNSSWFFRDGPQTFMPATQVIRSLTGNAAKAGNFLLNVSPTYEGLIPSQSVTILKEVGAWLKLNGESVYGTGPSPFKAAFSWGAVTAKPQKLYLHFYRWPGGGAAKPFTLYGLNSPVKSARLLASGAPITFTHTLEAAKGVKALRLQLPAAAPDARDTVVALEVDGAVSVDPAHLQQPDGVLALEALKGQLHLAASGAHLTLQPWGKGWCYKYFNPDDWFSWEFRVVEPGPYALSIISAENKGAWDGGHRVRLTLNGAPQGTVVMQNGGTIRTTDDPYGGYRQSAGGVLYFPRPGLYTLEFKPEQIVATQGMGLSLRALRLTPLPRTAVQQFEKYR